MLGSKRKKKSTSKDTYGEREPSLPLGSCGFGLVKMIGYTTEKG